MKNNYRLGAFLAIVGILAGILTLYFLAETYNTVIHTHFAAGDWEESNTVRVVYALLGWLGTAGGAVSAAVLWGFLKKQDWAWFWGAVAATMLLLAGFFPMIPAADSGLPTPTLWVFLLAAVVWFGMLLIGGVDKKIIGLTFVSRFTTGPSVRATVDSLASGTPNANYVELIDCVFPGWGVGYDGFEFRGANLGAIRRCTFTALANSGCGVAFRGSGSNNPVQNIVEECLFLNLVDGIVTRSATPQDNWIHRNRFMDISNDDLSTNGGAGNGFVTDNFQSGSAANSHDDSVTNLIAAGWEFAGNHYAET